MSYTKIQKLVGTALLTALVIVIQLFGSGLRVGPVAISLVLVPIVVGAVTYGPAVGAFLGGVFGFVVIGMILGGLDPASMLMMQFNAPATVITCLVKGILAGFIPGLIYKAVRKKNAKLATILAAALAPIMNTGFYALMVTFVFTGLMEKSYKIHGTGAVFLTLMAMIITNFITELITTVVISPIILFALKKANGARLNK
ncbi:ECF transporter S component [Lachnospiraceae bacterium YH-ros2228]|nr:ECF transporter S component [Lachnospiraceae bacterium]MDD6448627.1 ECF transporter S component [Lachnospiraceae bacterium]MDD6577875.1 ECF transporter S component [Lachnospiraceae bacterium]